MASILINTVGASLLSRANPVWHQAQPQLMAFLSSLEAAGLKGSRGVVRLSEPTNALAQINAINLSLFSKIGISELIFMPAAILRAPEKMADLLESLSCASSPKEVLGSLATGVNHGLVCFREEPINDTSVNFRPQVRALVIEKGLNIKVVMETALPDRVHHVYKLEIFDRSEGKKVLVDMGLTYEGAKGHRQWTASALVPTNSYDVIGQLNRLIGAHWLLKTHGIGASPSSVGARVLMWTHFDEPRGPMAQASQVRNALLRPEMRVFGFNLPGDSFFPDLSARAEANVQVAILRLGASQVEASQEMWLDIGFIRGNLDHYHRGLN